MKIEIKDRSNWEYYDEVLYIMSNYKKILNNPRTKVYGLTKSYITYGIISAIVLFAMIFFYLQNKSGLFLGLIIVFSLLLLFSILLYFFIVSKIKKIQRIDEIVIFNMDNKEISIEKSKSKVSVEWTNIKYICINKNSINFFPTNKNYPILSINVKYKNEIMEEIKKLGKESLVIENHA